MVLLHYENNSSLIIAFSTQYHPISNSNRRDGMSSLWQHRSLSFKFQLKKRNRKTFVHPQTSKMWNYSTWTNQSMVVLQIRKPHHVFFFCVFVQLCVVDSRQSIHGLSGDWRFILHLGKKKSHHNVHFVAARQLQSWESLLTLLTAVNMKDHCYINIHFKHFHFNATT